MLALVGAGLYWYYDGGRYRWVRKRWSVVEEHVLYRSGQLHPNLVEKTLKSFAIQTVVDLDEDGPNEPFANAELRAIQKLGIERIAIDGLDGSGIGPLDAYERALQAMVKARTAKRPLLIHCAAGSKRTGAAVAFFRLLVDGWDGARAYEEYTDHIRWHSMNDRLEKFINASLPEMATRLEQLGVISPVRKPLPFFGR